MTPQPPIVLRPYQEESLQAVDRALARAITRQVIVLPTGTGKAVVTAQLPKRVGTPLLLLAHREELLDQHAAQMAHANPGLRIGIEQAAKQVDGTEDVILASIPTLTAGQGRRLARLTGISWRAVIVDEVHHAPAKTWRDAIDALGCLNASGPPLIGSTATPRRGDGIGLHELFQEIVYQKTLREMINDGWCADIRAYAIQTDVNLDHVKIRHGDFAEGSLAHAVNTPGRNAILVEAWRRLAGGRRTLVFAANVLHAESVALSFRRAGIEALDLTGRLNRDERKARLQAFRKGDIPVLTSVSILTEGYDDPPLDCLILARPTKSPLLIEQMIGRITRISPGKTDSLILDVVDVSRRHKLQTVASLFGLPSRLNLKGRSATETAEQVERALSRHPNLQPELFATVEQLLAEAERMSLTIREVELVPHLSPEVLREADLAWIRLPSMEYALPLAGRVQIRVRENLLEQWEVVVLPDQTVLSAHPTRHEAFAVAEKEITERDPERARFARHEAAWRQHPVSKEQRRVLDAAGLAIPATKGEASQLIDHLREQRQSRWNRPATPRQRWRLKQQGKWQDGMTLGEATAVIREMTQEEKGQAKAHISTEAKQGVK